MKKLKIPAALALTAILLTGCASGKTDTPLERALSNIKPALTLMEERYALYEGALGAADAYITAPGEETLEEAKRRCRSAIDEISKLPDAKSALTEDDKKSLTALGLNIADYSVPFENEAYNREDCVQNLTFLLCFLDKQPVDTELVRQDTALLTSINAAFRKVDVLCLNELFCAFTGREIDDFRDAFLPTLKTLYADGLPWDTDSTALMARASRLMDDAEADIDDYAEFIGSRYTELMEQSAGLSG